MAIPEHVQQRLQKLGVAFSDLEERFVRGSGPGGQKINKTSSTVWLRHRPTGLEVRCQAERSQAANRERAWGEMAEKLEGRARAARGAAQQELEAGRRRVRQKSRGQKARMIEAKKHRSGIKRHRVRVGDDS